MSAVEHLKSIPKRGVAQTVEHHGIPMSADTQDFVLKAVAQADNWPQ